MATYTTTRTSTATVLHKGQPKPLVQRPTIKVTKSHGFIAAAMIYDLAIVIVSTGVLNVVADAIKSKVSYDRQILPAPPATYTPPSSFGAKGGVPNPFQGVPGALTAPQWQPPSLPSKPAVRGGGTSGNQ